MGRKGWHSRGYLPHFDGRDVAQHIVFRLADSAPPDAGGVGDDVLDRGFGSALLGSAPCADIVLSCLRRFDGERYALRAWCIMPNHVHVLIVTGETAQTGAILRSWKAYSAAKINALRGRRGRLWAPDYFDRYMRTDEQYRTAQRYIEMNPVNAGLCDAPEDWRYSSAWRGWDE
jgi:putative transposase